MTDFTDTDVVGEASDSIPCECSRTRLHCPSCGSRFFYHAKRLTLRVVRNGVASQDKGFRCRRCGTEFRESSTCTAPLVGIKDKDSPSLRVSNEHAKAVASENTLDAIDSRRTVLNALRLMGRREDADRKEAEWRERGLKFE